MGVENVGLPKTDPLKDIFDSAPIVDGYKQISMKDVEEELIKKGFKKAFIP